MKRYLFKNPNIIGKTLHTCQYIFSCIINDNFYYKIGSCFKQQQDNHFVECIFPHKKDHVLSHYYLVRCVGTSMFLSDIKLFHLIFICCLYICHCCGVPFVVVVVVVMMVCHKQFYMGLWCVNCMSKVHMKT